MKIRMLCRIQILIAMMLVGSALSSWGENTSHLFNMDRATLLLDRVPAGVTIQSSTSEAAFTITNRNGSPIFVPIMEIPGSKAERCRLEYTARMRSEEGTQYAFLEMLCVIHGKTYFSKGLNQVFSGKQEGREVSTPFFLKSGEPVETITLGVGFEGTGTVTVDRIQLFRYEDSIIGNLRGNWYWIPGTVFGVLAGLYGGMAGFLSSKGQSKSLIVGLGIFFISVSILMLITGILLWIFNQPFEFWYAFLLPGVIGSIVFIQLAFTLPKMYLQAELRKMHAKDFLGG